MKRVLKLIAMVLTASAAVIYAGDYGWLAYRMRGNAEPFADVVVDQVYTSTNKWKEVEWSRGTPVSERCVYALFPHAGSRPCWYVQRHTMNVNNTD